MNKQNVIKAYVDSSGGNRYVLSTVSDTTLGDYKRELLRVEKEGTYKFFYKGIVVSRSRITVDGNRGLSVDDIFSKGMDYITTDLNNDNISNREIVMQTDKDYWRKLEDDGSVKHE